MWFAFLVATIVATMLLYIPGFLLLRGFVSKFDTALSIAPIVSVALIALFAIIYGALGISCTPTSLLVPIGSLALLAFVFARFISKRQSKILRPEKNSRSCLLLYYLVGLIATTIVFLKNLDGPDSFFQAYDNWMHLGMVRTFLESGNFSSFNSLYASGELSPFYSGTGFYPSAWHAFVALVVSLTNVPITLGVNAVNAAIIAFVFTGSVKLLLSELFDNNKIVMLIGAAAAVVTVSFPWDFVAFGPLYPNLLSLSLVPIACVIFMHLIDGLVFDKIIRKGVCAFLFIVGCIAIALSQPNGIFTMAVFLAPFLISRAWSFCSDVKGLDFKRSLFFTLLVAVGIAGIWFVFYALPPLRNVVQFNWAATTTVSQAIVDVVTFGMTSRPVQLVIAFFFYIGALRLWSAPMTRWVLVPVAFSAIGYILSVSTEGSLKHLLTGFWYTDPHRLAALVGLFSIPVLACGMASMLALVCTKLSGREKDVHVRDARSSPAIAGFIISVLAIIAYPSFGLHGLFYVDTPFGQLTEEIESQNAVDGSRVLTNQELEFSKKAIATIPEGSLIINEPNDGSGFLYSLFGANLYYRKFDLPSLEGEREDSQVIRFNLSNYSSDTQVQEAVDNIDAKYVILLDQGENDGEERQRFWSYYPEQWTGIEGISDDTPGFTIILAKDDMRLYKIDR